MKKFFYWLTLLFEAVGLIITLLGLVLWLAIYMHCQEGIPFYILEWPNAGFIYDCKATHDYRPSGYVL